MPFLAFGVKILPDAKEEAEANKIPIFDQPIIYNLIDAYIEWARNKRESKNEAEFDALIKPGRSRFCQIAFSIGLNHWLSVWKFWAAD